MPIPTADESENRPPTQSRNPNTASAGTPNAAAASHCCRHGTQVLADAFSDRRNRAASSRAAVAFASVSTVVKVLEITTTSVRRRQQGGQNGVELGGVDVGNEVNAHVSGVVCSGGGGDHAWPEV